MTLHDEQHECNTLTHTHRHRLTAFILELLQRVESGALCDLDTAEEACALLLVNLLVIPHTDRNAVLLSDIPTNCTRTEFQYLRSKQYPE